MGEHSELFQDSKLESCLKILYMCITLCVNDLNRCQEKGKHMVTYIERARDFFFRKKKNVKGLFV